MNPIEELKAEHRAIETALHILADIAEVIIYPEKVDVHEDARVLIGFLKSFADTCHHGKEEGYLFPTLEQIGVSRDGGPIGVMLNEHQQGRNLIREMEANLAQIDPKTGNKADEFQAAATAYIDLLHHHIFKEDNVLFEIAQQRLSKVRLLNLARDFERFEQEKIGSGRHEVFHAMLATLKDKYRRVTIT